MPAYVVLIRDEPVRDEAAMAQYQQMNRQTANPANAAMTPLVVYGAVEALEGPRPDGMLILQFPTVEAARTWYDSPQYQAALPYRQAAADYRAMIVQGL